MAEAGATGSLVDRLFPFLRWRGAITSATVRPDLVAGLVGAVLILPQAFALATLAGMPPEYGIYTSIFPVIIAAIWGSSWHTLSGPNTAVCVLIAFTIAPFASIGSQDYIGYVLALTLMAGLIQLFIGVVKLGTVLDFISHTVISAIIFAVALIIIVSAAGSFLGLLSNLDEPFFIRLYQIFHDVPRANGFAVAVGVVTVATGLLARRYWRRYALIIAVIVGSLFASALNLLFGSAHTELELLGQLSISLLPLSMPTFEMESMYVLKGLITSAFSIAFLGLMQTVVIARSLAEKSGQHIDTNQEILGQGLSNIVAPFLSCFAGSGSFNRSGAHYEAGARTPMAALYASVFLAVIVLVGAPLIAFMPMATVAGALMLVGYGLIDIKDVRRAFLTRHEAVIFSLTFLAALSFGLNAGVFTGLLLSLINYLWYASTPNIVLNTHFARDGRPVTVVTIDGNLFFGSVRHVESALARLDESADENNILLLRTDHLTYLDVPGAILIAAEAKRRRDRGDDLYLYTTRSSVLDVLERSGCLQILGEDYVIHKDRDHPMKALLYPTQRPDNANGEVEDQNMRLIEEEEPMKALAQRLRATRLLGPLSVEQLESLLEEKGVSIASAGDLIIKEEHEMSDHLILIEGKLEAQRTWSVADGHDKSHTWLLEPAATEGGFAFLGAANRIRVRAVTDVRYVMLNADSIDELLGWSQQFADDLENDEELRHRMNLVKQVSVFHEVPLENVKTAFKRMYPKDVQAGDTVITEGEKGECYYVIDSGEAEVMRTDPFTDETSRVATLGPGDAFGEEALLQGAYRNATVTMTTPGRLLALDKADFDKLLRPGMVEEVDPAAALELVQDGNALWLDCRYDMEYEESRIPGAPLVPLDRLRWDVHKLDPEATYVVYCRSGRRSKAAAFLLRERNIKAMSMRGGIKGWPFEVDSSEIDASPAD